MVFHKVDAILITEPELGLQALCKNFLRALWSVAAGL